MWTQFAIGAILIFLGFAIHKLKWYFLISGYNTMSKAKKANVDTEGLGRLMGFFLYFNGGILILMGLLRMTNAWSNMTPFLAVIVVSTVILLVKAQKYDHNLFDDNGKLKEGAGKQLKLTVAVLLVIFLAVGALLVYVSQPTEITLSPQSLEIHGLYGERHPWETIDNAELHDQLPRIERRTNGSAVGANLKGHFRTTELGDVKLFVNTKRPPFIYITTNGRTTIFNAATGEETRQWFEEIQNQMHR